MPRTEMWKAVDGIVSGGVEKISSSVLDMLYGRELYNTDLVSRAGNWEIRVWKGLNYR